MLLIVKSLCCSMAFILVVLFFSRSACAAEFSQKELAYMPATVQITLFKQGLLSPVDVLEAQIAEFNKTNDKVNAATFTVFDEALKKAKEAEKRYADGSFRPLEGITVGIKDEHHDKGWVVSQGSLLHKNDPPKDFADPIVARLKAAGAIPTMQTTTPEFYLNFNTYSKAWGVTRNPWNLKYSVGGSSGGSCAALSAGYVTLATGSDMAGSIRIPSAFNGVFGYKPPFGEVHSDVPFSYFAGTGPLARTFEDMVLMRNVIAGSDGGSVNVGEQAPLPQEYGPIAGMKIAYVGGMGVIPPSKETQKVLDEAMKTLTEQGAVVESVTLSGLDAEEMMTVYNKIVLSGALGGAFAKYIGKEEKMTPYAANFFKAAKEGKFDRSELLRGEELVKKFYAMISEAVFAKGYDAMLAPTLVTSHVPAGHDISQDVLIEDGEEYPSIVGVLYTVPFNLLNWMPVVNVPVGLTSQNMPVGMQIIGKPKDTRTVFQVAYNYSKHGRKFFRGDLFPKVQ